MKVMVILIVTRELGMFPKVWLWGFESWKSGDEQRPPKVQLCLNWLDTEKSSDDLKRLVVTQTPVKDHQLILM